MYTRKAPGPEQVLCHCVAWRRQPIPARPVTALRLQGVDKICRMSHDEASPDDHGVEATVPVARRSTFTPAPPDAYERVFGSAQGARQPSATGAAYAVPLSAEATESALPPVPQRRSMPDMELVTTLAVETAIPGRTGKAIDQFEE
ncbi:MAG: hypothetical protein JWP30_1873, partial [Homoserinimonas sp.]|nr:hypothetical protein [Homoserinimonas sp.]